MQIRHGDRVSYSRKAERFGGEVAVTNTCVMAWLVGSASTLQLGRKTPSGRCWQQAPGNVFNPTGASLFADRYLCLFLLLRVFGPAGFLDRKEQTAHSFTILF